MKAMIALLRRELLEHRGAFLYAPAVLIIVMTLLVTAGMIFGHAPSFSAREHNLNSLALVQLGFGAIGGMWSVYLLIALHFYYADSFSADGRNNALLFWKSMPQSDLKILTSKALAGITVLPAMILFFALVTMLLVYLLSFPLAARLPIMPTANPLDMLAALFGVGVAAAAFFIMTILWYAPFLALVAGLSVLVKRWAIPAAILVLGALVVSESILTYGNASTHPIRSYLSYRLHGFGDEINPMAILTHGGYFAPFELIGAKLSEIDWTQTAIGILFAIAVVYGASEYRRRRLDG